MPASTISNAQARDGDLDGDGHIDAQCANLDPGAPYGLGRYMGDDCDDTNPAIVPGAMQCESASRIRVCSWLTGPTPTTSHPSLNPWFSTACPSGGRCVVQPNGTGVCVN